MICCESNNRWKYVRPTDVLDHPLFSAVLPTTFVKIPQESQIIPHVSLSFLFFLALLKSARFEGAILCHTNEPL